MNARNAWKLFALTLAATGLAVAQTDADPDPFNYRSLQMSEQDGRATVRKLDEIQQTLEEIQSRLGPGPARVVIPASPSNQPEHVAAAEAWLARSFSREGEFWQTYESSPMSPASWRVWQLAGVSITTYDAELRPADKLNGADGRFIARFRCDAFRQRYAESWQRWQTAPAGATWQREFTRENGEWKCSGGAPFIHQARRDRPPPPDSTPPTPRTRDGKITASDATTAIHQALDRIFLRRGTDWFTRSNDGTLWHLRIPNINISDSVSEVDRLNGVENNASANLHATAHRSSANGEWTPWHSFLPGPLIRASNEVCRVRRVKGEWSVDYPDKIDERLRPPRTDELPADVREEKPQ